MKGSDEEDIYRIKVNKKNNTQQQDHQEQDLRWAGPWARQWWMNEWIKLISRWGAVLAVLDAVWLLSLSSSQQTGL